jgi:heptosyltransferase-2
MGPRVLIIKLGALGDVVRTASLLPTLRTWPEPPHITWLTAPAALPLVRRMPGVDRALPFTFDTLAHLELEQFDTVLSLDKEPAPCAVAMRVRAESRLGVGLSRYGTVYPLNEECEYYFQLGLDNEEKFRRNQSSMPELIHAALGFPYAGQRYELAPTADDRAHAAARLAALGVPPGTRWVGINPGAGAVFANKAWREAGYVELIHSLARRRPDLAFLMLGGSDEAELIARIMRATADAPVFSAGTDNPLGGFAALIERCAVLVCGDTLALHLAVAVGRRVVSIFGPTCAQEIELFGLGEKIVTPRDCAPCYRRRCSVSPGCMDAIPAEWVEAAVLRQLDANAECGMQNAE